MLTDVVTTLRDAVQSGSLMALTKALGELTRELDYQLMPPYTHISELRANEEGNRFAIRFAASLYSHYSGVAGRGEGLIFEVRFRGEALADSPSPAIDELFYAGKVQSLKVYGYGSRWKGKPVPTPKAFSENLEVSIPTLNELEIEAFLGIIEKTL